MRTPLTWSSRLGFILTSVGAAVGLGNIWKFPYITGTQGGGAFVLIYLLSIFAIAIPVAIAELVAGRAARTNTVDAMPILAKHRPNAHTYRWIGLFCIFSSFMVMTFYAVIGGWVLAYLWRAIMGGLTVLDTETATTTFTSLLANPYELILWQASFLAILGFVLTRDIRKGLESANMVMIPLLFAMLFLLVIYGGVAGDLAAASRFLFTPDFSKITGDVILSAVGHGFFSVGVGFAILLTYGAYIGQSMKIGQMAIVIGLADTAVALLAGLGIFSIVLSQNLPLAQGAGLTFTTVPLALSQLPATIILNIMFFVLVLFAALTSALGLTEVSVRWSADKFNLSRGKAVLAMLIPMFLVGLISVFSFNIWQDVRIATSGILADKNLFEVIDYIMSTFFLPIGGLMLVSVVGWIVPQAVSREHFNDHELFFQIWLWLARIVAPIGIVCILIYYSLGG